jgi:hypothetical protein
MRGQLTGSWDHEDGPGGRGTLGSIPARQPTPSRSDSWNILSVVWDTVCPHLMVIFLVPVSLRRARVSVVSPGI